MTPVQRGLGRGPRPPQHPAEVPDWRWFTEFVVTQNTRDNVDSGAQIDHHKAPNRDTHWAQVRCGSWPRRRRSGRPRLRPADDSGTTWTRARRSTTPQRPTATPTWAQVHQGTGHPEHAGQPRLCPPVVPVQRGRRPLRRARPRYLFGRWLATVSWPRRRRTGRPRLRSTGCSGAAWCSCEWAIPRRPAPRLVDAPVRCDRGCLETRPSPQRPISREFGRSSRHPRREFSPHLSDQRNSLRRWLWAWFRLRLLPFASGGSAERREGVGAGLSARVEPAGWEEGWSSAGGVDGPLGVVDQSVVFAAQQDQVG